ncbi:hypothetical protein AA0242T_0705 [Acetobacter aceti NRIC 0242]|nr:hypothetical protein AA0242T_0705 [Acetobacter aceti NRIC 0242]
MVDPSGIPVRLIDENSAGAPHGTHYGNMAVRQAGRRAEDKHGARCWTWAACVLAVRAAPP